MSSPFHAGEIAAQARAGVRAMAERVGRSIHDGLAPAAAAFLAEQPFLVLGGTDAEGAVWASWLEGSPGLVAATDAHTLVVTPPPVPEDPLAPLPPGDLPVQPRAAILAIDFATRRRLRVNGTWIPSDDTQLRLRAEQVYWNCPKYIQRRLPLAPAGASAPVPASRRARVLAPRERRLVASADTFFIATLAPSAGADVSHRGGEPGFVQVGREGDADVLTFPDYSGNTMFNTLGNLLAEPRAGLLFVDFRRGTTLQVSGTAEVLWDGAGVEGFPGAERAVRVRVEQVRTREHATRLRWRLVERSPFNPPARWPGS